MIDITSMKGKKSFASIVIPGLLSSLLFLAACTEQETQGIRVEDPWIAEAPAVVSVTAGMMTLYNDGNEPRFLTEVRSPDARSIEIHRSVVVDDLARMARQDKVEIPARSHLEFSHETGYHLMFYGMENVTKGSRVPVTLYFGDGSTLAADYEVRDRRD